MKAPHFVVLAAAGFLSACAYWPPYGEGGQAEDYRVEEDSGQALYVQNGERLACFHRHLQTLKATKPGRTHPAALAVLDIQWARAKRAHAARMMFEAREDLDQLAASYKTLLETVGNRSSVILISETTQETGEVCQ